jgi:hypothetical protein
MMLKANSYSSVSCWDKRNRSYHWSFDPPWAFALVVSWHWPTLRSGSNLVNRRLSFFSSTSGTSIHWSRDI